MLAPPKILETIKTKWGFLISLPSKKFIFNQLVLQILVKFSPCLGPHPPYHENKLNKKKTYHKKLDQEAEKRNYKTGGTETSILIFCCIESVKQLFNVIMHGCICTNLSLIHGKTKKKKRRQKIKTNIQRTDSKASHNLSMQLLTLSIQVSKSASLKSCGGLVTPESRVKVVGMNCNKIMNM